MGHNQDIQQLMQEGLTFARAMLQEHGEFFPFAMMLDQSGEISPAAPYRGPDTPEPEELIQRLEDQMRQNVASGLTRAVAIFVRVRVGSTEADLDAVQISVEHASGYASNIYVPFSSVDGEITLGQPFATDRTPTVFQ